MHSIVDFINSRGRVYQLPEEDDALALAHEYTSFMLGVQAGWSWGYSAADGVPWGGEFEYR